MKASWILAALPPLTMWLVAPGRSTKQQRAPFEGLNIAHRGLHSRDKTVPENSLPAFREAAAAGYGAELDVQLSREGEVVVFHDDTLERVCGVSGRVDSYSLASLQQMHLCGTEYTIPTFAQVLEAAGTMPLVVELKSGPRNRQLCRKTLDLLRGYPGPWCIESFDPRIVAWFRKNAPDVLRGQLADEPRSYTRKTLDLLRGYPGPWCIESFDPRIVAWFRKNAPDVLRGQLADEPRSYTRQSSVCGFVLGNLLGNCLGRPQFIAWGPGKKTLLVRLCEWMGVMKLRWTVRPNDHRPALEGEYDGIIFEFETPAVRYR